MSFLLVAALLVATASMIATSCVAYIVISFRRSGRLMASRIGRQQLALVLVNAENSRRRQSRPARRQPRLLPIPVS